MWTLKVLSIALVTCLCVTSLYGKKGFKGKAKSFTLREVNDVDTLGERTSNTGNSAEVGPDGFPEEMEFILGMEGKQEVALHLVRNRLLDLPEVYQQDQDNNIVAVKQSKKKKFAFYTDTNGHGSFACKTKGKNGGKVKCQLSALLDLGGETCFIGPDASEADCTKENSNTQMYLSQPKVDPALEETIEESSDEDEDESEDGDSGHTNSSPAVRYVEVVFMPDAKFMELFYERHPSDTSAAEDEAVLFFTLLANEMNVYYSSILEASNNRLELFIYPSAVVYPGYGRDYYWSAKYNDGTSLYVSNSMDYNVEYAVNSGFIKTQFDHVIALTGYSLKDAYNGNKVVSYSYTKTVCTSSRKRYSVVEYISYNLGRLVSHEVGHALGAYHDTGGHCPAGLNVMSYYLFSPDETTQDTFSKFSTCSALQIIDHLNSQWRWDCLNHNAFTEAEFLAALCAGFLGEQAGYLDQQCQRRTGWAGSIACDDVTEEACYKRNIIRCRDSSGSCSTYSLNFVWTGTPCDTGKFCYKGRCVDELLVSDLCKTSTTSTPSTTTTTPTTTTTTPTTTTTTPTTTTTTPTTTTTTPTTTTTTPTTTTTTPTTTTTTPTTTTTTPTTTTTTPTTTTTTPTTTTTTPTTTTTTPTTTTTTPTTTTTTPTTTTTTPTTTTTTPTTTTTTPTTTTTTPTTTTTTPTTTTTTPTTTTPTTTVPYSPCGCCGFSTNKRRRKCCRTGTIRLGVDCYCCGDLKNVEPPPGWEGERFIKGRDW